LPSRSTPASSGTLSRTNYPARLLTDAASSYPGPTLRALELLQQEQFRKDILSPTTVHHLTEEGIKATLAEQR
jgi:hypothetical protein